ncbi:MAG: WecB/TagA/CpsF family glycosyltransferase [Tyzzerella sp.]|nr:WecB/TagA/CpsF family glycosyltransferase [Tyzzerella sp.]
MKEKMQVLGVELDNCTAKYAMKRVVEYVKLERINVVEMVTMNTLARFQQSEESREIFETFDLALPSDRGILQAAGVKEEWRLKEVDEFLFIKMVMRYLQKNRIRVFLLAETQSSLQKLEDYIQEEYGNLRIIESASLEERGSSDDMLLNLVNGAEAECVLSTLPSPVEEYFISRNKSLVNARIWLGFGHLINEIKKEKRGFEKVKDFLLRKILQKEVEKERRKNDIVNNDSIEN